MCERAFSSMLDEEVCCWKAACPATVYTPQRSPIFHQIIRGWIGLTLTQAHLGDDPSVTLRESKTSLNYGSTISHTALFKKNARAKWGSR